MSLLLNQNLVMFLPILNVDVPKCNVNDLLDPCGKLRVCYKKTSIFNK